MPDELKPLPCPCGAMPIQETQRVSLGRVEDGGYDILIGRYKCPVCGNAPSWGQSYSVMYGWDKNIDAWNRRVGEGRRNETTGYHYSVAPYSLRV